MRSRPITELDLEALPGLRAAARDQLPKIQPATVFEALCIGDVGRGTTRELLTLGVLTDPERVQGRRLSKDQFERWMRAKDRAREQGLVRRRGVVSR